MLWLGLVKLQPSVAARHLKAVVVSLSAGPLWSKLLGKNDTLAYLDIQLSS